MENLIEIKNEYNSLETLNDFLKNNSSFESKIDYDKWEIRKDANGQMEKCIILKKSGMHALRIFFANENTVKVNHFIPNPLMNAYFGKSEKMRRDIIEIIAGKIKDLVLAPSQKKAFEELEAELKAAAA